MIRVIVAIVLLLGLAACKDDRDQTIERRTSVIIDQANAMADQSRRQLDTANSQNQLLSSIIERQNQQITQADMERRQAQERLLGIERMLGAQGRSGSSGGDIGSLTATVIIVLGVFGISAMALLFVWKARRHQQSHSITITIPVGTSPADVVEAVATAVRIEDEPRKTSRRSKQLRASPSKRMLNSPF